MPNMPSSHYARCRLGTAEQREAWVASLRAERVEALRDLSRELTVAMEPKLQGLWQAKGRQLSSLFEENKERMTRLGLPPEASRALIREALAEWVSSPTAEPSREVSDSVLDRFPSEIRDFLRPTSTSTSMPN
jgi:hypothetical protein